MTDQPPTGDRPEPEAPEPTAPEPPAEPEIPAAMPPSSLVLDLLRQAVAPKWDGVLLDSSEGAQVLPGVYHKRCLKLLARQLSDGGRSVTGFLRQLHRHLIPQEMVNQAQAAPPKTKE